jgi:hypothetical protein
MKNKKNHTPGPWKIEGAAINDSEGTPLALCCSTEANAALIAAAPDLLEALLGFDRMSDKIISEGAVCTEMLLSCLKFVSPMVKAAIKKAGGN